jgi:probable F420-dependent oxidoreductase
MVLAKELATLDHLSQGRLVVGVGVGSLPDENAALGVPFKTRGLYADEFLTVLKKLWTEEEASFEGQFFDFKDVISSPRPLQRPHPPLVIGGNKRVSLKRVAVHGDGWHPLLLTPDGVKKRMAVLKEEVERAGRAEMPLEVQLRVDMSSVDPGSVLQYEDAGVTELVVGLGSADPSVINGEIDRFSAAML